MKNFYEMLKLLEDEQVKTPGGYTLTPDELEDYEREKSPMYKALFLKDIDAKRKLANSEKIEKPKDKTPESQPYVADSSPDDDDIDDQELSNRDYCFQIINVIRHFQDRKYTENYELEALMMSTIGEPRFMGFHENKQIADILENSKDLKSAIGRIVPILEKLGLKISNKVGSRSKFDPNTHQVSFFIAKPGEEVVLLSDVIMFKNEVLFEAAVIPINEYTLKVYKDIIENPLDHYRPTTLSIYKYY